MKCANCGAELSPRAKFCRACGTPAGEVAAGAAPEAEAPPAPAPQSQPAPVPTLAPTLAPQPAAAQATQPLPPQPAPVAATPAQSTSQAKFVAAISALLVVALIAFGIALYYVGGLKGWFGTPQPAKHVVTTAATTTPPPPIGTTSQNPAVGPGEVVNLKDKPTDATLAGVREDLLDSARRELTTSSRFFVNQLWVGHEWAIGDMGAEEGGHRMWFVWHYTDHWRTVWTGDYGYVTESLMKDRCGISAPELFSHVDWNKPWQKEFVFK